MAQATIAPPTIKTLADLRKRLGGISLDRIWFHPAPGTATEKDVIEVENRENRLCELVDGALVEKAMGFDEARLALRLGRLIDTFVDQNDLGVCVGADGMMRIGACLVDRSQETVCPCFPRSRQVNSCQRRTDARRR